MEENGKKEKYVSAVKMLEFKTEIHNALKSDLEDNEIRNNLATIGITNTELPLVGRDINMSSLVAIEGLYFLYFNNDSLWEALIRLSIKIIKFNYNLLESDDVTVALIEENKHMRFRFTGNALKEIGIDSITSGWPSMKKIEAKSDNNKIDNAEAVSLKLDSSEIRLKDIDIKEYGIQYGMFLFGFRESIINQIQTSIAAKDIFSKFGIEFNGKLQITGIDIGDCTISAVEDKLQELFDYMYFYNDNPDLWHFKEDNYVNVGLVYNKTNKVFIKATGKMNKRDFIAIWEIMPSIVYPHMPSYIDDSNQLEEIDDKKKYGQLIYSIANSIKEAFNYEDNQYWSNVLKAIGFNYTHLENEMLITLNKFAFNENTSINTLLMAVKKIATTIYVKSITSSNKKDENNYIKDVKLVKMLDQKRFAIEMIVYQNGIPTIATWTTFPLRYNNINIKAKNSIDFIGGNSVEDCMQSIVTGLQTQFETCDKEVKDNLQTFAGIIPAPNFAVIDVETGRGLYELKNSIILERLIKIISFVYLGETYVDINKHDSNNYVDVNVDVSNWKLRVTVVKDGMEINDNVLDLLRVSPYNVPLMKKIKTKEDLFREKLYNSLIKYKDDEEVVSNLRKIGVIFFRIDKDNPRILLNGIVDVLNATNDLILETALKIAMFLYLDEKLILQDHMHNFATTVLDKSCEKIEVSLCVDGCRSMIIWNEYPMMKKPTVIEEKVISLENYANNVLGINTDGSIIKPIENNQGLKEYEVVLKFKSNASDAMEFCQEFYRLHPQLKKHWELTRESKDNDNISEILERALKYEAMFLMNVDMFININPDMDNNIKDGGLVNPDIRYDASSVILQIRNNMVTKRLKK